MDGEDGEEDGEDGEAMMMVVPVLTTGWGTSRIYRQLEDGWIYIHHPLFDSTQGRRTTGQPKDIVQSQGEVDLVDNIGGGSHQLGIIVGKTPVASQQAWSSCRKMYLATPCFGLYCLHPLASSGNVDMMHIDPLLLQKITVLEHIVVIGVIEWM